MDRYPHTDDPLRLDEQREAEPIKCDGCGEAIVERPDIQTAPGMLTSYGETFCSERCKQARNAERFESLAGLLEFDAREVWDALVQIDRAHPTSFVVQVNANHIRRTLNSTLREYGVATPGGGNP